VPISPENYARQRDALVEELRRVASSIAKLKNEDPDLDLSELSKKEKEIASITRRVYEDQFKFVLIAQSQGGKSTTFNAIGGGSVISPMGNAALKCSAAPIVELNVTDQNEVGAYVYLRTEEDLRDICAELLGAAVHSRDLNLRNKKVLARAQDEHKRLLDEWLNRRREITDEQRDLIFNVGLILAFYDTREVRRLYDEAQSSTLPALRRSVTEAGKMARFPEDFVRRYAQGIASAFRPEEVYFPFIRRIVCKIASENLRRIGATVTDSPGLFANNTDTRVAMGEIHDADAVWYLLDAKQISEYERRAIRECSAVCQDRIFFSANIKGNYASRDFVVKRIIPSIAADIRTLGGDVTDDQIYPYHALLALLATQGPRLLSGASDQSVEQFLLQMCAYRDIEVSGAAEAWVVLAGEMLRSLSRQAEHQFNSLPKPLCSEGIELVRRESGLDQIITKMEQFVVARKAASILLDNGASRAVALLQMIEQRLATREATAGKSVEESKKAFQMAERKLDEVRAFADDALNPLEGSAGEVIDLELAADMFDNVLVRRMETVADAAAPLIREEVRFGRLAGTLLNQLTGDGPSIPAKCRSIVEGKFESELTPAFTAWSSEIQHRRSRIFNRRVLEQSERITRAIQTKWAATIGNDELLKALPAPPAFRPDTFFDTAMIESAIEETHIVAKAFSKMLLSLFDFIGTLITDFSNADIDFGAIDKSIVESVSKGLASQLRSTLERKRDQLLPAIARTISGYRESCVSTIRAPLKDVERSFDADKAQAELDWARDLAEQKQIAEKSKKAREEHIQPLREGLERFVHDTAILCDTCT